MRLQRKIKRKSELYGSREKMLSIMGKNSNEIYTIGHSTHPYVEFLELLRKYNIEAVADVRNFPGSRKFPHFNKDHLEVSLPADKIAYHHFKSLGGRRKPDPDSENTAWRHMAFRGYADYMSTDDFKNGIAELIELATKKRTAMMCSEAVWWRCHRSMLSDLLKSKSWKVLHILSPTNLTEHPYTAPAKIIDDKLSYKPDHG